jgi:hypothetical protein
MKKPAAIIDKSLLEAIYEQQDSEKRSAYCGEISKRYQVVVSSVLVEELWVNLANPCGTKSPAVLENMKQFLI